jgi:hypothetical protein
MIPHERSLVNKLEGKSFALIGVNSDTDPEQLKKDLKDNKVTWRSFQNMRPENNPIADEWNVRSWPTLFLIDHNGIIKKKWVGSPRNEVLDKEVEKLVQAAANGKTR